MLTTRRCLLEDVSPQVCKEIDGFEHLDFLWAETAPSVYDDVIQVLYKARIEAATKAVSGKAKGHP